MNSCGVSRIAVLYSPGRFILIIRAIGQSPATLDVQSPRSVVITRLLVPICIGVAFADASCSKNAPAAQREAVVWRPLGSWSGHGSMQTEPFISDTGSLRLTWKTSNETPPGAGNFRVTLHSDVSGRPLLLAVDAHGVGHDVTYVSEDPRSFFLAVESANVDWTVTADEGFPATVATGR